MKGKIFTYKIILILLFLYTVFSLFLFTTAGCITTGNHSGHNHEDSETEHNHAEESSTDEHNPGEEGHEGHDHGPAGTVTIDEHIKEEIGLKTQKIEDSYASLYIETMGEVIPNANKLVNITPLAPGKVKIVNINPGDYVKRETQLALVSSPDLATAIADLKGASQEMDIALKNLGIKEGFANTGAYAGPPYEEKQLEYGEAKSAFIEAKENLKISEAELHAAEKEYEKILAIGKTGDFDRKPLDDAKSLSSQAEQEYLQAENEFLKAQTELERSEKLYKAGIISKKELLAVQTEYENIKLVKIDKETQMEVARGILEREEAIYEQGVRNDAEVERAKADYVQAEKEYNQAKGDFEKAKADMEIIEVQLGREESIYTQDLNTSQEIQEAEADYRKAQIEYEKAAAVLDSFSITPETAHLYAGGYMPVVTPINGYILERNVNIGEIVVPETVMFKVLDTSTLWIDSEINENDLTKVKPGQTVEITTQAYSDRVFSGNIFYISNTFHQETRTFDVRISFDNKEELLKPGMTVNSRIITEKASGIVLPSGAVLEDKGEDVVFVKVPGKDNVYERRVVDAKTLAEDRHMIISGLSKGEEVVIEGTFQLRSEVNREEIQGGCQH